MFSAPRGHSLAPRQGNQGGQDEANRNLRSDRVWMCHDIGGASRHRPNESARPAGRIRRYSSEPEQPGRYGHADGMPAARGRQRQLQQQRRGRIGGATRRGQWRVVHPDRCITGQQRLERGQPGFIRRGRSRHVRRGAIGRGRHVRQFSGGTLGFDLCARGHRVRALVARQQARAGNRDDGERIVVEWIGQQLGRSGHVWRGHAWRRSGKLRRVGERSAALQGDRRS